MTVKVNAIHYAALLREQKYSCVQNQKYGSKTEVGTGMIENERKEKKWRNFSTPSPFLPWKPEANQSE